MTTAPQKPASPSPTPPRSHSAAALLGAWFLCVVVPCPLIWCRNRGGLFGETGHWQPENLAFLFFTALILLTPLTLILAWLLLRIERKELLKDSDRHFAIGGGAIMGVLLGLLNFPGYLGMLHFPSSDVPAFRVAALYLVTGAICGAWVGWQAYREWHPECPLFPRYSLGTLVLVVVALGILIGVFVPR